MAWTSFSELIDQYRRQADLLEQKIKVAQASGGFDANYKRIELLSAMKSSLEYSIRLMNQYRESEESP